MDLSVTVYFTDSENEDNTASVPRRQLRDMHNVLEMPTQLFVANFRVTKDVFRMLHEEFEKYSAPSYRSTHVRGDVRLATFLRFLATGSYQQTVGNEIISSTSKATVSRVITECLDIFEKKICRSWIKMPLPEEEVAIKKGFFESSGFPGVVGSVDGTHVRIKSPGDNLKHLYYNRKGYYSINAMVICDHKTKILYVDGRHPGANHDAFIWDHSSVDAKLQESYDSGNRNSWILGDSAYPLKPFLMTPFRNPSNTVEKRYNKKHASARNVVERCFGVLKNRFRCIIGSRGLHYGTAKTTKIINSCCALHNICLYYKCPEPDDLEIESEGNDSESHEASDERASSIRRNIANNL